MDLNVVVLAAGQGTRMKSSLAKVLHPIGGKAMLAHVIQTAKQLNPSQLTVVVGFNSDSIKTALSNESITWVTQTTQLGTGDAVSKALSVIKPHERVLILYGDVPLIGAHTLQRFMDQTPPNQIGIITAKVPYPFGLGRIVRDKNGAVQSIIEERDANESQRQINEINSGILLVPGQLLHAYLPKLSSHNAQGELYLTDIIAMAVKEGVAIETVFPEDLLEIQGINDRNQQALVERHYQMQQANQLMQAGVYIVDPMRFDLRGTLKTGKDVKIDINVILEGDNVIGSNCQIGPHCVLINCKLGDGVEVRAHSYLENAVVGNFATIGPFSRLRPQTVLAEHVKIGNFVEVKNAQIAEHTKISHLSYIGDATIGKDVNIGAGTITCNYDGVNKHRTIIEEGVQIGSDTQLIAPVKVGKYATIGAGSTIKQDVPEHQLTITHQLSQRSKDWQKPSKK